jgi:hypothetical protein
MEHNLGENEVGDEGVFYLMKSNHKINNLKIGIVVKIQKRTIFKIKNTFENIVV